MERGKVKNWIDARGFGFISRGDGADDIFVHRDACGANLYDGACVSFDVRENPKRPGKYQAINVSLLDEPSNGPVRFGEE